MPVLKPKLKMFIVLRWDLSADAAVVAAAHASLGTYLTFIDSPLMQEWQKTSFIKKLCQATDFNHFQHLKSLGRHRVFTESSLNNSEVSIGFDIVPPPYHVFDEIPLWRNK
jgi:peptidyl-tRNA hydrolase